MEVIRNDKYSDTIVSTQLETKTKRQFVDNKLKCINFMAY